MKHTLKNHIELWKLCFKTEPLFMLYYIFDGFRNQFFIFVEHTIGIKYVLECAEFGRPFSKVAIFLIGLTIAMGVMMVIDGRFQNWMVFRSKPRLYQALKERMFEKAQELDLECYDNPEYYNKFVLSVAESEKTIDRFLDLVNHIAASITVFVTVGGFFILNDAVGLLFAVVSFVMTFVFSKVLNKLNVEVRTKSNPKERKCNYVQRVFYLNDYAKEIRLNPQISGVLEEEFETATKELEQMERNASKKRCMFGFLRNYISGDFLTDGLYIIYLVFQAAVLHRISYSAAVVLFHSVNRFKNCLRNISDILPKASENSMYLDKIKEFLAYEPKIESKDESKGEIQIGDTPLPITFKNVSFAYNEKDGAILNNINLTLHPGEKVALVGYNGAGKTTLIKVLMRLYDPTDGDIFYGDTNIRDLKVEEYRNKIGVVFQDYKMYGASLCENVVLDDIKAVQVEEEKVKQALEESGFGERLQSLEQGLLTQITTEFDEKGVNLSGGESQKVAISRVFYRNNEIMIMDEPSSALDPIAEYALNSAMHKAAKNKTVVYISHRLSTTRDADCIYMLEKGSVIEKGTHEELLKMDGKYAQMWHAQAGRYTAKGNA